MYNKFEHNDFLTEVMMGEFKGLRHLPRWSGHAVIKPESVAEHCYYVGIIAGAIGRKYEHLSGKTLDMAKLYEQVAMHDVEEVFFGDLPSPAKKAFPYLLKSYERAFKESVRDKLEGVDDIGYKHFYNRIEEDNSIETKIMKIADVLHTVQYVYSEYKLGNRVRSLLDKVISHSVDRIKGYEDKYFMTIVSPVIENILKEINK